MVTRQKDTINGVKIEQLKQAIERFGDPQQAKFVFRARNDWQGGSRNRSQIAGYSVAGQQLEREQPFALDCDEPPEFTGRDSAPNPVEYLLHALAGCVTTTLVMHAAARGIEIQSVQSELEGDIDVRGFLGLDKNVPRGFQRIRLTLRVASAAPAEQLAELVRYSPVFNSLTQTVPIELKVQKRPGSAADSNDEDAKGLA